MYRLGQYVEFSPVTVNMMRKNDYCNIQEVKKINTTDPEANIMQFSDKTKKPACNGLIGVDGKNNVIVA